MPAQVALDGESLSIDDVVRLARPGRYGQIQAILSPAARERVVRSRERLERAMTDGAHVYGVTTGFGALQNRQIDPEDRVALQMNLVRSHAAGVGPFLTEECARALMVARANSLAKGYSGIRLETLELLLDALNRGLHPAIPSRGSVGASGDLAPLAHLAEALLGEGQAWLDGHLVPSARALAALGLKPLAELAPKEGVALINGTALMAGNLVLALVDAEALADLADAAAAMALEALRGHPQAYSAATHQLRPHPGQIASAAHLRELLNGSQLALGTPGLTPTLLDGEREPNIAGPDGVQDPYSLRCTPQVHGATRDALAYVRNVLSVELNSANDNPLLIPDGEEGVIAVSQGNFHGQPLSLAADLLAIALVSLGNISERRTAQLLGGHAGLPPFLAHEPGLQSGLMVTQYTAAALVAESRVLAHPASIQSIPTSGDYEDHVSMGVAAVDKARRVVSNARTVVAIELLVGAQALDEQCLRHPDAHPAPAIARLRDAIREVVPFITRDHPPQPLIESVEELISSGRLGDVVASG